MFLNARQKKFLNQEIKRSLTILLSTAHPIELSDEKALSAHYYTNPNTMKVALNSVYNIALYLRQMGLRYASEHYGVFLSAPMRSWLTRQDTDMVSSDELAKYVKAVSSLGKLRDL